ncbi:hypothetical protein J6590_076147 [Homalodisca vitripennis]|nr:hypothetical protein J6590_076147 [Homalodisca vitripennis]
MSHGIVKSLQIVDGKKYEEEVSRKYRTVSQLSRSCVTVGLPGSGDPAQRGAAFSGENCQGLFNCGTGQ